MRILGGLGLRWALNIRFFILVVNQLDAQYLFHNKFIKCLYMFRALRARHQEVKIVLYSLWYQRLYNTIFDLLTMSTWCSKHVEA